MPEPRALPDQAARELIERELGMNILVEAGAGSGKTEHLARRMAAGIAAGVYEVEGMAAVTFTRKAAAELRARFQLDLERRLAEGPEPAARVRLETALARLERLFAGTIHAFCAHLLRERPVEAGVAPGFTELDDLEDDTRRRAAWRDYGVGPFQHGDSRDRPPETFGKNVTLHCCPGRPAYVLLPVIPPDRLGADRQPEGGRGGWRGHADVQVGRATIWRWWIFRDVQPEASAGKAGAGERVVRPAAGTAALAEVLRDLFELVRAGAFVHTVDAGDRRYCELGLACGPDPAGRRSQASGAPSPRDLAGSRARSCAPARR
jgi:hypothetical protein